MVNLYYLSNEVINGKVAENKRGAYIICNDAEEVVYVGRSHEPNLKQRLKDHVNEHRDYKYFAFSYASTEKKARMLECELYHRFGGENIKYNKEHPSLDAGEKCPYCEHIGE